MINKFLLQNKASAGDVASDMQKTVNDQRKLQQMINYCETDKCLREFILSYFGDTTVSYTHLDVYKRQGYGGTQRGASF